MVVKFEKVLLFFIDLGAEAKRDNALEARNHEILDRRMVEIEAAPEILERLPQDKREGLLSKIRAVQIILATVDSQERFASENKMYKVKS